MLFSFHANVGERIAPARWSRPLPGRFHFLVVDFGEMVGRALSQSTKSLCKTIVDLPFFRARSSPRRIASYTRVLPIREAAQTSLILSAMRFDMNLSRHQRPG